MKKRQVTTSVVVFGAVCAICIIVAISVKTRRRDALMFVRLNNFRTVALAFPHGTHPFPPSASAGPDGRPLISWRAIIARENFPIEIAILPREDEPWDSLHNQQFAKFGAPLFCDNPEAGSTYMLAVTGADTAFESGVRIAASDIEANLIVVMEAEGCGIRWMEPGDFVLEHLRSGAQTPAGRFREGFCVVFGDRQVWLLDRGTPREKWLHFCSRTGAREYDRDLELGPYARWRKRHD